MNDGGGERAKENVGEETPQEAVYEVVNRPFSSGVKQSVFEGKEMAIVLFELEESHGGVDHPLDHRAEAHLGP